MALAILKVLNISSNQCTFEADIGTSSHYRYCIGSSRKNRDGFEALDEVTYKSPIQEQNGTLLFQTRFKFTVPKSQFDRRNRFIQLSSFKNKQGKSSAWSKVIDVWPKVSFSHLHQQATGMSTQTSPISCSIFEPCRSISQSFMESHLSSAMFWNQLFDIARLLAPSGSKLLTQVVNQGTGSKVNPSDVEKIIKLLLQTISTTLPSTASSPTSGQNNPQKAAPAKAAAISTLPRTPFVSHGLRAISYKGIRQRRFASSQGVLHSQGLDGGVISGPALIGLITTLGPSLLQTLKPLLEKSPQLLKTFIDSPLRLFNAIAEVNRQEQKLNQEQINNMIKQGNQALLYTLLQNQIAKNGKGTLSQLKGGVPLTKASRRGRAQAFATAGTSSVPRVDARIQARLVSPKPIDITGKPRSLYSNNEAIKLRLVLEAENPPDRPIPKVIAHLKIKAPNHAKQLFEHRYQLQDVFLNRDVLLTLKKSDIQRLPVGIDLLVSVDVTWLNPKHQVFTIAMRASQTLLLSGTYGLKSVGSRLNQAVSLKDPTQFRAFWHRIWEGGSAQHRRWELNVMARYYYRLRPNESSNGLMETKFKPNKDSASERESRIRWEGFVKSGLEVAPGELNKLLPLVFGQKPWVEEELGAISIDNFSQYVDQQATAELSLRGRRDERGSVWVFPVMDLVSLELYQVSAEGDYGEVTETISFSKSFPVPISAVFVGMENEL